MKWPGTSHYDYQVTPLGEDEFGKWFGRRGPTPVYRGDRFLFEGQSTVVILVPYGNPRWKASWYADHAEVSIYVDIIYGLGLEADGIKLFDVDLDVVKWNDGRVKILDADEFEEHAISLKYPAALVDGAAEAVLAVKEAIEGGAEPFRSGADGWFGVLSNL